MVQNTTDAQQAMHTPCRITTKYNLLILIVIYPNSTNNYAKFSHHSGRWHHQPRKYCTGI